MTARIARKKLLLAGLMYWTGVSRALLLLQKIALRRGFIRAINYHGTPRCSAGDFERHLHFYQHYFSNVTLDDLRRFLNTGRWHKPKPGLILSFDDGFRTNCLIAAPLLERYGFTGWFFVPTGLITEASDVSITAPEAHTIDSADTSNDEQQAMTWDDLRELSCRHIIGSHTRTHTRMHTGTTPDQRHAEIVDSKGVLEEQLERQVEIFCWVGGEEHTYTAEAAKEIVCAGYRFAFMTNNAPIIPSTHPLQLQRTNIEAGWPLKVVEFQLSGVMDLLYTPKRRRVNRLTAVTSEKFMSS